MEDGAARRPGILARLRAAAADGPLGNRSFLLLSGASLRRPSAWMRCPAVAVTVAAGAGLLTSCSGSPWWSQTGTSACGPPALVRIDGHVAAVGDCAGLLIIPALKVKVRVGQEIDVHMLAGPPPYSSRRSVLMPGAITPPEWAPGTYQPVHPGRAALISRTWPCLIAHHRPPRVITGNCPVIGVTVVP
jgi:hypothetical protein